MRSVPFLRVVIPIGLLWTLTACEEGAFGAAQPPRTAEDGSVVIQEARTVIQEVERGDIFSTSELALWDGRPSLGGIWVAHPDVTDPERVRITNTVNGEVVSGALFRRERNNPGPRIQVSSDAAAALAMLAGQPTELSIIVLRQEEIVIEPAVIAAPDPEPAEEDETAQPEETPTDEETDETAALAAAAVATTAVADAAAEAPRKGFWERFRDSLRNDPAPAAAAEVPEAVNTVEADVAETAAVPDVETAPLDTVAVAAAAIAAAEAEEAGTPEAEETAEASGSLRNPFIQIGLFGEQANASAAASSLRQAGIVPTVSEGTNANGPFWRILVGPVSTADDQAELLAQVKSLGYTDAFLTSN